MSRLLERDADAAATTSLPAKDRSTPDADRPRALRAYGPDDALEAAIAVAGGVCVALLLRVLLDWSGVMSSGIWCYVVSMALYWVLVRQRIGRLAATDRVMTLLIISGALVVVTLLVWMIGYLLAKGLGAIDISFLTDDLGDTGPADPGGGVRHAIIGTFLQVGLATVVVVPVGILTAVYLHELKGRAAQLIRFVVDALAGLPSIVAGLLVYTTWVIGRGFSGFAAAMALAVLMLPTITRTAEEILRTVPDSLREASLALGAPQWRVIVQVVLPTARAGLVTGAILGIARAIGETAPVLLTAGGSRFTNSNLFEGNQADLPLTVWDLIRQPNQNQIDRAWGALLVLVTFVLILFVSARWISGRADRKLRRSR